mgnify:CR=1
KKTKEDMKYEIYQPGQKKDFIKESTKKID